MVDHVAGGGSEAVGSEVLVVAVTGEDEEVHGFGGGGDFVLDAAAAGLPGGWALQLVLGVGEECLGGLLGDRLQGFASAGGGLVSSEQAAAGGAGEGFWFGVGDVQQRDVRVGG